MGQSIVIICTSFPPEKGGAPTRIYNLSCLLRDNGYEVTVLAAMPNYPTGRIFDGYKRKLLSKETIEGIKVYRTWIVPSNSPKKILRALSMISHTFSLSIFLFNYFIKHKPDAVIVSSPPLVPGFMGVKIARLFKRKIILNISDIWPLSASEMGAVKPGFIYQLLLKMERSMYRTADAFTGQSQEIFDHISTICASKKPSFLYRNLQETQCHFARGKQAGIFRIIYAGNLGVAQGMLEICRQIDFSTVNAQLAIYGDGVERQEIERYIQQNPNRKIIVHPTVSLREIPSLLRDYDCVLIPLKTAIYGAVPSKLFMAVANGLPVLFSGGGEGAALVKKYGIGFTSAPGNYPALRDNISRMSLAKDGDFEQFQQNSQQLADTIFSKDNQDQQFLLFLKSILS